MTRNKSDIAYGQSKQTNASDEHRHVKIAQYLRTRYKCNVWRECFILFRDYNFVGFVTYEHGLTQEQCKYFQIKRADFVMLYRKKYYIIELDGEVHRGTQAKDSDRNDLYELNGLNFINIKQWEMKNRKKAYNVKYLCSLLDKEMAKI